MHFRWTSKLLLYLRVKYKLASEAGLGQMEWALSHEHSRQMFDWLRALISSSFPQHNRSISMQHSNNKCVPQLILGPFWTFWRVFTDLPTKNIARLRNAILSLIFRLIGPYTLPINIYWRRLAISKG